MTLEPPKIAQPIDMVLPVRFAGPVRSAPRIRNCTAPGPACQTGHQATGAALEGPVAISITLPERMSQSPKSIVMFYTYFYMLYVVIYIYIYACVCVCVSAGLQDASLLSGGNSSGLCWNHFHTSLETIFAVPKKRYNNTHEHLKHP